MKQDDLVSVLEKTKGYVDKNPSMVRNVGIAIAAVIVLGGGLYWWRSSSAAAAADLMREAQSRLNAQVLATGADPMSPTAPSYASDAERDKAALESFTKLATTHSGSAEGRVAQYYQGMLLARAGKAQEAEAALTAFIGHGSFGLMTELAKVQLAGMHAQRGDLEGAAKMYSEIADAKGAYPRDWALHYLAGIQEKQGKKDEAAKTYAMLAKEFPASSFSAEATRKSTGA
jgi:TolA-binding protein